MQLQFGLSAAIPEEVSTAWGARLIEPADLVYDRQDIQSDDDDAKSELVAWLDGGALHEAREYLRVVRMPQTTDVLTLFEDARGIVVGSTNRSYGYVYVAGWLKP